jgi:hypothetical protein
MAAPVRTTGADDDSPSASLPPHRKRHAHALVDDLFCPTCQVTCNSEASFLRHRTSRHHLRLLHQAGSSSSTPSTDRQGSTGEGPHFADVPIDCLRATAIDQLASVFTTLWGSFELETVHALFLLRRDSRVTTHHSARLRDAATVEEHSALLLSVPRLMLESAPRARATLACADIPEHQPTLRLEHAQRLHLQRECLRRALLTTVLAENMQLLNLAVHSALHDGSARAIITDATFGRGYFASSLAALAHTSSAHPTSAFHSAWHASRRSVSPTPSRMRRRSETDMEDAATTVCVCNPSTDQMRWVEQEARQLRREHLAQCSRDEDDNLDLDADEGLDGDTEDAPDL